MTGLARGPASRPAERYAGFANAVARGLVDHAPGRTVRYSDHTMSRQAHCRRALLPYSVLDIAVRSRTPFTDRPLPGKGRRTSGDWLERAAATHREGPIPGGRVCRALRLEHTVLHGVLPCPPRTRRGGSGGARREGVTAWVVADYPCRRGAAARGRPRVTLRYRPGPPPALGFRLVHPPGPLPVAHRIAPERIRRWRRPNVSAHRCPLPRATVNSRDAARGVCLPVPRTRYRRAGPYKIGTADNRDPHCRIPHGRLIRRHRPDDHRGAARRGSPAAGLGIPGRGVRPLPVGGGSWGRDLPAACPAPLGRH